MFISLLNALVGILPQSWKQTLDGLDNVFLRQLRVKDGPLVMEPCFHITSVPAVDTPAAANIIGYCDCGRVIAPGDGVLFEKLPPKTLEADKDLNVGSENPLDQHILLRNIENFTCKGHCVVCRNSKRGISLIGFGTLNVEGVVDRLVLLEQ